MASKPVVYLAGPVGHVADGGAGWRDDVVEFYEDDYDFRNPLSKYNVPVDGFEVVDGVSNPDSETTVGVDEIVNGDKALLEESDGVLVGYSAVRSIGTPMEVMWAYERDYPIAIWIRDGTDFEDLSPWYRHHASAMTNSLQMALGHIARQIDGDSMSEGETEEEVVIDPSNPFRERIVQLRMDGWTWLEIYNALEECLDETSPKAFEEVA